MNKKVLWITQTAILTALLIILQASTAALNNTLITGSLVNLVLVSAVILGGLETGLTVAAISPVFAKLLGIGPFWSLIPFIILGNLTLVLVWHFVSKKIIKNQIITYSIACVLAAVLKFAVLFLSIVKVAVPFILKLPEPQASVISASFSFPQLITALIGGAIAILFVPSIKKALKK